MKGRGRGAGVARLQQRLEDATQVNARGWGRLRAVPAEPTGLSPPGERAAAAQPAALRGRSVRAAGGAGAAAGGSLSAGPAAQKRAAGAAGAGGGAPGLHQLHQDAAAAALGRSTNRILRESDGSLRSALLLGSCGGPEAVRADCSVCPWQSSASSEDSASPSNTSSQSSEDACSASPAQGTQDPQAGKVEGCCHPAQRCCKRKLSAFAPELAPSPQGSGMGEQPTAPSPVYRLVLAGDSGAGKSSFLLRLCRNEFRGDISSTLGVDFQVKELLVDGEQTTLQIWDTAGQESDTPGSRYRSIARSYFRKAHGVLLLYDISSQSSFLSVRQWIEDIEGAGTALPLMLVGNKSDLRAGLPEMVGVHTAHGQRLAMVSGCCRGQPLEAPSGPRLQPLSVQAHNCLFCETSAKDGTNVVEAVLHLARAVKRTAASGSGARLDLSIPAPRAAAGCCRA
ncbi:EF-hand calcium-binding domain-containing protein 4B-like isoform X21 [Gallus gallus]|uniref:EF-hand calcium-binding domain-containing protein 4B-like isoform X21 n=1 Tax=Gallus gallus TaxID=9031 RepID=UPI001AE518E1|nr:EF-hand calcium-binding domain-containing protein 4B-like isoform X21 [Gallus gallus]